MAYCVKMVGDSSDNNEDFERFSVENVTKNNANYLETIALLMNDDTDISLLDGSRSE